MALTDDVKEIDMSELFKGSDIEFETVHVENHDKLVKNNMIIENERRKNDEK